MPSVYIDAAGDVRSTNSGRVIAPAGTTARTARMQAALWAATAEALANAPARPPAPTPITAAPSHPANTDTLGAGVVTVIDVQAMCDQTAADLHALTKEPSSCR